jgi:hypothetical protein
VSIVPAVRSTGSDVIGRRRDAVDDAGQGVSRRRSAGRSRMRVARHGAPSGKPPRTTTPGRGSIRPSPHRSDVTCAQPTAARGGGLRVRPVRSGWSDRVCEDSMSPNTTSRRVKARARRAPRRAGRTTAMPATVPRASPRARHRWPCGCPDRRCWRARCRVSGRPSGRDRGRPAGHPRGRGHLQAEALSAVGVTLCLT